MHASAIFSVLVATVGLVSAQAVVTPPLPGSTSAATAGAPAAGGSTGDLGGCDSEQAKATLDECLKTIKAQIANRNCGVQDYNCLCEGETALNQCYANNCAKGNLASGQNSQMVAICAAAKSQPSSTVVTKPKPSPTSTASGTAGTGGSSETSTATSSSTSASSTNGASAQSVSVAVMSLSMVFAYLATL